jgi:acetylornithine deacetylase/succinyl-diaminopimelate desuccinylase-like protein
VWIVAHRRVISLTIAHVQRLRRTLANVQEDISAEVTDLLQQLIRNECVNDGTAASGKESRSVDTLSQYLGTGGLDIETYEPIEGRASLVARIEGTDANAPTLLLMGHTDVVPANEDRWQRDPFSGDLVTNEDGSTDVWGRGAVDMLNLTASMAVATKHLAQTGFRPKGTLVYLAVADEEALGTYGAEHLVTREHDAVAADYVITESGGIPIPSPQGLKLPVIVGEKGTAWCRLRVKGTAGHASQPFRTDNALVTAAEIVRRLDEFRPPTMLHDVWRRFIESMGYPDELTAPLLQEEGFVEVCESLPLGMGRQFHACTHTTMAPTIVHGGSKINVIPDTVDLELDIRTLPGQTIDQVYGLLDEALGDLRGSVDIVHAHDDPSTASPVETPLWDALSRVTQTFYEGSATVPFLTVGATDARFFRRAGSTAYGFGLFSTQMSLEDYGVMFHGDDERVDVESLRLSTELWNALAHDFLG